MKHHLWFLAGLAVLGSGCDGKSTPKDDGQTDPDVPPDDVQPDDAQDVEADDVTVDDVPVDDGPLPSCNGSGTLTLAFSDLSGAPVQGIPVALRCGDRVLEATSDAGGLATFSGLDLSVAVDTTYVYNNLARSMLGLGGSRTVPSPFPITVGEEPPVDVRVVDGSVTHAQPDSWVIVTSGYDADVTNQDTYEFRSPIGTAIPMSVLEYTSTGSTATPIGYSLTTYDTPAEGDPGPAASAAAATFESKSVMLHFDIRSDSPLRNRLIATDEGSYPNRTLAGIRYWAADASENMWIVGLTTFWNKGDADDTLTFHWIQSAIDGAADTYPSLLVIDPNYMYYVSMPLPEDPDAWPASFTVNDTPQIAGINPTTPVPFDHTFPVDHPAWASMVSLHIRLSSSSGVLGNEPFLWSVLTHPETTSFSFSSLPWPSTVPMGDVIPNLTLFAGVVGVAYDADPYGNYILWTDDAWAEDHYTSSAIDSRFRIEAP